MSKCKSDRTLLTALLLVASASTGIATGQVTTLVSATPGGQVGNAESDFAAISADGKFIAFCGAASNLVAGDPNPQWDIFVRDRIAGVTSLASVDSSGVAANGRCDMPKLSRDGRFVAFVSDATNLVAGDTNGFADVFVRDLMLGTTTRVSVSSTGVQANAHCSYPGFFPAISNDGRYVAFTTAASTLVGNDYNGMSDVYVHDCTTGITSLESVSSFGLLGDGDAYSPSLSEDGQYVAFLSGAQTLVIGDTNGFPDIFVRDRQAGVTERVSVDATGVQANHWNYQPVISGGGRYVAFTTLATNLVSNDTNGWADVMVFDRQTGEIARVSVSSSGEQANSVSEEPCITDDGRYVGFHSFASNLTSDDTNGDPDVFILDRETGEFCRASLASPAEQYNGGGHSPGISDDGRWVAFVTESKLVPVDGQWFADVYLRDTFGPWLDMGSGLTGQTGTPALTGAGSVQPLTVVTFSLTGALPVAPSFIIVGISAVFAPFKGGVMVPSMNLLFAIQTDSAGSVLFPVLWPPGMPSGLPLFLQSWIVDPAGPVGFSASNGLQLTIP